MIWNDSTPFRTGVPTLRTMLKTMCRVIAVFSPVIKEHLTPSRHVYLDDLMTACEAFLDNVPNPPGRG